MSRQAIVADQLNETAIAARCRTFIKEKLGQWLDRTNIAPLVYDRCVECACACVILCLCTRSSNNPPHISGIVVATKCCYVFLCSERIEVAYVCVCTFLCVCVILCMCACVRVH